VPARADKFEMHQRAKEIARLASGPNPPTRRELADHFGISPRQVNNLIAHVEGMLGCDVVTRARDSDGKMAYVVQASDLLKLDMSVSEAIASVHITQSVLGTPLSADDDAAGKAVGRLEAALAETVRGKLRRLEGRFAIRMLQAAKPPRPEVFRTVLDGILENRVLHMGYESPYKAGGRAAAAASGKARKVETVAIEPYGLFFAKRSWYLVANKRPGQGMRQYKLARIRQVSLGEQAFTLPRGWTVDGYLRNSWEIIVEDKAATTRVVIDLDASVAGNTIETRWHPSQTVDVRPDGSARLAFSVAGTEEVFWWVMGMGSRARVVAPAELRGRVRAEVEAMRAAL
jgi:predicted DNA-binding transcriptional regulator YafY